jgi:hypothetical protein
VICCTLPSDCFLLVAHIIIYNSSAHTMGWAQTRLEPFCRFNSGSGQYQLWAANQTSTSGRPMFVFGSSSECITAASVHHQIWNAEHHHIGISEPCRTASIFLQLDWMPRSLQAAFTLKAHIACRHFQITGHLCLLKTSLKWVVLENTIGEAW